ncbi:MAG: glycine cleavage system protein GcvH [Desulfobacteraceae bacterium]
MKAIQELLLPEEAVYTDDHEWALQVGEQCTVGITDYAQDQLGDIVFVELPEVGERFKQGDVFGTVESVKAVAELFMPVSGEITEINEALTDAPELVNTSPYDQGWLVRIGPDQAADLNALMDREAYRRLLEGTA